MLWRRSLSTPTDEMGSVTTSATKPWSGRAPVAWNLIDIELEEEDVWKRLRWDSEPSWTRMVANALVERL